MESTWDYRLTLTEEEGKIKEKVLKLLEPFNTETASHMTTYFEEVDEDGDTIEELGSEYDTCTDDDCINNMIAEIKISYPDMKINHYFSYNDSDHERIERCHQCGKPLNEGMTWIETELDHYLVNKPSLENLKKYPNEVFDLVAIFESFPSNDEEMGGYQLHQKSIGNIKPFNDNIESQKEFKKSVIGLMNHVINEIDSPQSD